MESQVWLDFDYDDSEIMYKLCKTTVIRDLSFLTFLDFFTLLSAQGTWLTLHIQHTLKRPKWPHKIKRQIINVSQKQALSSRTGIGSVMPTLKFEFDSYLFSQQHLESTMFQNHAHWFLINNCSEFWLFIFTFSAKEIQINKVIICACKEAKGF